MKCFHTKNRGGKAFAAEQKIREFKKILLRSKRFEKIKKNRIKPNQLIKNAAENMNKTVSAKYGIAPENIEKSLDPKDGKYFQEVYNFMRLKKIQNNEMRVDKCNQRIDRRKKTLRSLLNIAENALVLAKRLKKKDAPGKIFKSSSDSFPFFNRNRIFTIYGKVKLNNNSCLYWLEENESEVKRRRLRQQLFALNNQFLR